MRPNVSDFIDADEADVKKGGPTDLDNARKIAAAFGNTGPFALRYVRAKKDSAWWGFRGEAWRQLSDGDLIELAILTGQTANRKIMNAISVAKGLDELNASPDDFDRDPFKLNTGSGTLTLTPGKWHFGPAEPADYITQVMGTDFIEGAEAPTWERVLEEVLPDPAIRWYLQRLIGYALVGEQSEAILPILIGDGFNGKSTFVDLVATLFGTYGTIAEKTLFKVTKFEQHATERVVLQKMRLAHSEELPAVELDEPKIKGLTGDDRFSGRGMRENFRTIKPSHTFLIHTNKRPIIRGTDQGIWRRVVLIPFDVQIKAQDRTIKDKLRAELPGILNWALYGLAGYQAGEYLTRPPVLNALLEEYRQESDTVSYFVNQYEADPEAFSFGVRFDHEQHALAEGFDKSEIARNYRAVCEALGRLGGKTGVKRNPATDKVERGWHGIRRREAGLKELLKQVDTPL